jgi:hypothetical protein
MGSPPAPSDDPVSPGVQRDIAKDGPSHSSRKRIAIAGATLVARPRKKVDLSVA